MSIYATFKPIQCDFALIMSLMDRLKKARTDKKPPHQQLTQNDRKRQLKEILYAFKTDLQQKLAHA